MFLAFRIAHAKRLFGVAADLYRKGFAIEPSLADDLSNWHRYNAARSAALAGAGKGHDAAKLSDQKKFEYRKHALVWLRQDLAALKSKLDAGQARGASLREILERWQENTDLAGIRDQEALKTLPATERQSCLKLWASVSALLESL